MRTAVRSQTVGMYRYSCLVSYCSKVHLSIKPIFCTEDGTEVDKPRPKKRKVEEKRNITKYGRIVKDKRLLPQKISKTKLESLRCNVQDQLLLEYADQVAESLTR